MTGDELQAARNEMNVRAEALASKLGISLDRYEALELAEELPPAYAMAVMFMVENPDQRPELHIDDINVINAADIDFLGEGLFDGQRWGPWRLNLTSHTLDLNSRVTMVDRDNDGAPIWGRSEDYYIMLQEVTSARGVVDWLGQIAGKGWGAPLLGYLTLALDDIFSFQGRFAHEAGFENMAAVGEYLNQVIQPREDTELLEAQGRGEG